MDVAQVIMEVFDIGEDDVIRTMSNRIDGLAVRYAVRLPSKVQIEVRRGKPKKKRGEALWVQPPLDLLEVTIRDGSAILEQEVVLGRDELVAVLSLHCQDPEPGSPEAIRAQGIQWRTPPNSRNTFIAEPKQGVLLRVMKGRDWRNWTWAIIFDGRVVSPEDMPDQQVCPNPAAAQKAAEDAYKAVLLADTAAASPLALPVPPVIMEGGLPDHAPVDVEGGVSKIERLLDELLDDPLD